MKILKSTVALLVLLTLTQSTYLTAQTQAATTRTTGTQTYQKSKKHKIKDLPRQYQTWLQKDVLYLITKWEKEVFLQLDTDRERDMFIAAFWKNRDPNLHTEENEFKTEHYKRIQYAIDRFGKGTPTPGWLTARGRIYIMLGEAHSIERYEAETEIYPVIIWFYQGLAQFGLPNAFSVVFFKENNSGDYELYSPVRHGPHKLLVNYQGDTHEVTEAFSQLYRIVPNVAKVSMSLIEGEFLPGARPTISSEILINQKIVEAPKKRVNDEYAKKLLKYKNYIDVEYSVNYITNASQVSVLKDAVTGYYFIHYMVEPQKLSLEQVENTLYGNLEINGSLFDLEGKTIYNFSKNAPITLNPDQVKKVQNKLFCYQDFFPVIPGNYRLEILIRNTSSKEFTSIERNITVPSPDEPGVGNIVLANTLRPQPPQNGDNKPFLFNGTQLVASPRNDFTRNDKMHFFFQVLGLKPEQVENGYFQFAIIKDDGENKTTIALKKPIKDYAGSRTVPLNFMETFSLEQLDATYYSARVSVYGAPGKFLFQGEATFFITPVSQLKRPWIVSVTTPPGSAEHYNTLAIQYANINQLKRASSYLERAYNLSPSEPKVALNYVQVLFKLKRYNKLKSVALPFLQTTEKQNFLSFLGYSCANLGQYMEAITHFKEYLSYYGTNMNILNAVGECYQKLGNIEEAKVAWKKSLELFPDQKELTTFLKELTKKQNKREEKNE